MNKFDTRRRFARERHAFKYTPGSWNPKVRAMLAAVVTHHTVLSDSGTLKRSGYLVLNKHIAYLNW